MLVMLLIDAIDAIDTIYLKLKIIYWQDVLFRMFLCQLPLVSALLNVNALPRRKVDIIIDSIHNLVRTEHTVLLCAYNVNYMRLTDKGID